MDPTRRKGVYVEVEAVVLLPVFDTAYKAQTQVHCIRNLWT